MLRQKHNYKSCVFYFNLLQNFHYIHPGCSTILTLPFYSAALLYSLQCRQCLYRSTHSWQVNQTPSAFSFSSIRDLQ